MKADAVWWIGPLAALWGIVAPLVGWSIRSHLRLSELEHKVLEQERFWHELHAELGQLGRTLQDVRLEVARLGALQSSMNEAIHRIEDRLEA